MNIPRRVGIAAVGRWLDEVPFAEGAAALEKPSRMDPDSTQKGAMVFC